MIMRKFGWGIVVALGMAWALPARTETNPVTELPGRWSGWGTVTFANGSSEQLKCIATYFVEGGSNVRQNLRCANQSYNIDSEAKLSVNNGRVTGAWEEKRWSATGSVAGKVAGNVFNLSIQGDGFSAAMNVSTSSCKQSINIMPQGFDIQKISIGLGKC